jgi:hypothetical protein
MIMGEKNAGALLFKYVRDYCLCRKRHTCFVTHVLHYQQTVPFLINVHDPKTLKERIATAKALFEESSRSV